MATTELLPISVVYDPNNLGTGTWNAVNEEYSSPTDGDYISLGVTNSGATVIQVLGLDASSIPVGATINSVTLKIRGKSTYTKLGGDGLGSYWGGLSVGGNWYQTAEYHDGSLTTHSIAWTTNPDTGSAWMRDDVAGSGSHPLQGIGVRGTPWPYEAGETWTPTGGK